MPDDTKSPEILDFKFKLVPAHKKEDLVENIRSSVARKIPRVIRCHPHDAVISIAGGGPSLAETCTDMGGYIAAINGSLAYLLSRNIIPNMCGICDPSPHIADLVDADKRVAYFVASCVHPSVFDKLLNAGCQVYLWHASSVPGTEILDEIEPNYMLIGGGATMGLRWIPLAYTNGFREFHLYGLDSSFRDDPERGRASHAYPDHQDKKEWIWFHGFQTRTNFIGQVSDFLTWMDRLKEPDVEPVIVKVFGDGLLPNKFKEWKERNPGAHEYSAIAEAAAKEMGW